MHKRDIGQHFVFGFHGTTVSEDIRSLICDHHVGNVILMKRNIQSIVQTRALVAKLQLLAHEAGHLRPLMIGIDQENGLVSAFSATATNDAGTQFPGAMALASSGSIELAEQVSAASGQEMRLAGINWAYSPVADINSDPRNPVIGVRSFGDDPAHVAQFASAVARGLASAGIAPCAKHFPGHGATSVDSHLALPRLLSTPESLKTRELVPFVSLIDDRDAKPRDAPTGDNDNGNLNVIASVMTGHLAVPAVSGTDEPASLCSAVTHGLLRRELGYEGVIVTDRLEMEAVSALEGGVEEGAVRALAAGADVVMACHTYARQRGAVQAVWAAAENGRLDAAALQRSGARVRALKDRWAGTWDEVLRPAREALAADSLALDAEALVRTKEAHALLSAAAYARCVALVRPAPAGSLPLLAGPAAPIVLFTPMVQRINQAVDGAEIGELERKKAAGVAYEAFRDMLAHRAPVFHIVYGPGERIGESVGERGTDAVRTATQAVFVTRNGMGRGRWQIEYLKGLVKEGHLAEKRTVLASTCAPYDLMDVKAFPEESGREAETSAFGLDVDGLGLGNMPCFATFEWTVPAMKALADVLDGDRVATASVPVCNL